VVDTFFVLANNDQALAAEPGFHPNPPQCGGAGLMFIRHFSDHRSEPLEQQPKNGLPLALGPTGSLRLVVEEGARGAASQTPSLFQPASPFPKRNRDTFRVFIDHFSFSISNLPFSGVTSEIAESSMLTGMVTPVTFREQEVGVDSRPNACRLPFYRNLQAPDSSVRLALSAPVGRDSVEPLTFSLQFSLAFISVD
jgi:hypothetical protein